MSNNGSNIVDLDLRPEWARRPAGLQVVSASDKRPQKQKPPGGDRGPRRESKPKTDSLRTGKPVGAPGGGKASRSSPKRVPVRNEDPSAASRRRIRISFVPERGGLKPLARWLAETRKAHSLAAIASMFLSKPQYFAVKLESVPDGGKESRAAMLHQCSICRAVFIEKQEAVAHALDRHLSDFYSIEEVEVEPPSGNFTCVARCRLSGELLGPPNYHGYNDRVSEMQRTRFPAMSLEEYRKHVVNVKDEALLEQWKSRVSRRLRYSTLKAEEPKVFTGRPEIERHFMDCHAKSVIRENSRLVVPGAVLLDSPDGYIGKLVHESRRREQRFPAKIGVVLHSAFRRMGLHVFRTADNAPFVSAILPNRVEPSRAAERMRCILTELERRPGCERRELVERVEPGAVADPSKAAAIVSKLCWLIERGHVIEFSDGRLATPSGNAVADGGRQTEDGRRRTEDGGQERKAFSG